MPRVRGVRTACARDEFWSRTQLVHRVVATNALVVVFDIDASKLGLQLQELLGRFRAHHLRVRTEPTPSKISAQPLILAWGRGLHETGLEIQSIQHAPARGLSSSSDESELPQIQKREK